LGIGRSLFDLSIEGFPFSLGIKGFPVEAKGWDLFSWVVVIQTKKARDYKYTIEGSRRSEMRVGVSVRI